MMRNLRRALGRYDGQQQHGKEEMRRGERVERKTGGQEDRRTGGQDRRTGRQEERTTGRNECGCGNEERVEKG
jgi:hypothetical protein